MPFAGASLEDAPLDQLAAFAPGGVMLFARNVGSDAALRALVGALRANALPPLVAVDQEGGRVARLGEPLAPVPSALALAAGGDLARCERIARRLGAELAERGFSVDAAPVADLALHAENTVVGTRAFGDDPQRVAAFAAAFARGLLAGGVAPVLKHFPGHGDTRNDSHERLPRVPADAATLRARDVAVFARVLAEVDVPIVMLGHLAIDAWDPGIPASCSARAVRELRALGFAGVIATDCLEMGAVTTLGDPADAAVRALAAGVDMPLFGQTFAAAERAALAIEAALASGALSAARVHEAAERVARLRQRYARLTPAAADWPPDDAIVAARAAVTIVRGALRLRKGLPVTVISFEGALADGAANGNEHRPSLSAALRKRRWKSEIMRVPLAPDSDDLDLLLDLLPSLGERNFVIVTRRAFLIPAQRAAVAAVLGVAPDALVIVAREPDDLALFPQARSIACIYGDDALAIEGCADVLDGRANAGGVLPLRVPSIAIH